MMRNYTVSIVSAAALLLAAISCKPENLEPQVALDTNLTASMEQMLCKTGSPTDHPSWSAGDRIAVFTDAGTKVYSLKDGAGAREAVFSGSLDGVKSLLGTAIAPEDMMVDAEKVKLPSSYQCEKVLRQLPVMKAEDVKAGGKATFRQLGALLKVAPEDAPSEADGIVLESDCRITGEFPVVDGQINAETGKSDRVVFRFAAGKAPTVVFIPVPVGNITFSYAFLTGDVEIAGSRREAEKPLAMERRTVCQLNAISTSAELAGKGTQSNPYLIRSKENWAEAAAKANADEAGASAWYALGADLDLSVFDMPVFGASESLPFKGHFDGRGYTLDNVVIFKTDTTPACPFLYCDGASISGLNFRKLHLRTNGGYCAIVGHASGTTVENCSVEGEIFSSGNVSNYSYTAGIIGRPTSCTIKGCSFKGNVSAVSNHCGGIAGTAISTVVENCTVAAGSTVSCSYYAGGIVANLTGSGSAIRNCSCGAIVSAGTKYAGGMVAYITEGVIEGCLLSGKGIVTTKGEDAGGIVGRVNSSGSVTINRCASYGDVSAQYEAGGIVGIFSTGSGASASITNCYAAGCEVRATGKNGSNYALAGGLVGFCQGSGTPRIANCAARPAMVSGVSESIGALAGLLAYQSVASASVENCYVSVAPAVVLYLNAPVINSSLKYYGSFLGRNSASGTPYTNCHYDASFTFCAAGSDSKETRNGCRGLTAAQFSDGTLLSLLNEGKGDGDSWKAGDDRYPVLTTVPADTDPKPKNTKRVSIIGDSISTFHGWVLQGYSTHYPNNNNCDVSSVDKTWWHRVIYKHMKNARIDLNISFGNTTVTQTLDQSKADQYWFNRDYCTRFIECSGVGRPDIIFIHGGTNDYGHNTGEELAPGYQMRGSAAPSDAIFNSVFAQADAATTITASEGLPYNTFLSAYVKLMQMIKVRYPSVKVVCIIGDCISAGMQKTIQKVADHYGARTVDFLAVNGYMDTEYMTKYSGVHPDANGMAFMAEKIYSELGAWLEE